MKHAFLFLCLCAAFLLNAAERPTVKAVLFPFREAIVSARVDSALLPYKVKIGEPFQAGAVLAALDDSRYAIEVKRAAGQYEFAKATFADKKELRAKNFTSDYELKKAEFDFQMAETSLSDAKLNLSFCTITAPFAGKIVEITTREYETTRPGQPLFKIIDDNQLLAVLNVPLGNKKLTTPGSPVSIQISDALTAKGKVYEVTPQADNRTETVRIRVLIDNKDGKFTAGMTGELLDAE